MNRSFSILIVLFLIFIATLQSSAAPLGTIPTIEDSNLKLFFETRSDLWVSPYRDKAAAIRIYNTGLRIPFYKDNNWVSSFSVEGEGLSLGRADILVGKNQVALGSDFRSQSFGFGATRNLTYKSSFSFFTSYASASDEPFKHDRDKWIEATAVYRTPMTENHHWLFVLNQSENRGFENGHLVPYFGMIYEPSSFFEATFGFPFLRIISREEGAWRKTLFMTPGNIQIKADKDIYEKFNVSIMTGQTIRAYLHENRIAGDERLYFQEKYIESGFKTSLSSRTDLQFTFGWAFDRSLYESEMFFQNNSSTLHMPTDIYGRLGIEFKL